jgi:hypothetical protein
MPRNEPTRVPGVWEKDPGTGVWWASAPYEVAYVLAYRENHM